MKKFLTILLKLFIILVGILLGGAMLLTCWLAPLPPGEANLKGSGVSVSCTTLNVPSAHGSWFMYPLPAPDTWRLTPGTPYLDTWHMTPDLYTWNLTLFSEETWMTKNLA